MRILVTGGAGFIGSHVVDAYLDAGHTVWVLDDLSAGRQENLRPGVPLVQGSVTDPACLAQVVEAERPELVSHHAAQISVAVSVVDPVRDAEVNILGTLQLLKACVRAGVRRVIFASTGGAMYGDTGVLPASERSPARPASPYGVAKLACEHYLRVFHVQHGIETVSLRYANVYGPRQSPHGEAGVVAIFCHALRDGRPVTIHGDGAQTRDFLFVSDVVRANLLALHGAEGVFNLGTGVETPVTAIASGLQAVSGRDATIRHGPAKPGEQRWGALDAGLVRSVLGWTPHVSLAEGLATTWAWVQTRAAPPA